MSSLDDPNRVDSYLEKLPFAYLAASIQRLAEGKKSAKPTPFEVGRVARELDNLAYEKSPAYRIAMAYPIYAEIVDVEKEAIPNGVEYFKISYRELNDDSGEILDIKTPFLNDSRFGATMVGIWDRAGEAGRNFWCGKKMVLYKHNEEPKPGDKASKGYKRLVYAEPLN